MVMVVNVADYDGGGGGDGDYDDGGDGVRVVSFREGGDEWKEMV